MMSYHIALQRIGHLKSLFHMFSYLNNNQNSEMLFDTTVPDFDMYDFQRVDWGLITYVDVKE